MNNMDKPEYDKVEKPALDQLQQYGWLYVHGSELTPEQNERAYMRDVVSTISASMHVMFKDEEEKIELPAIEQLKQLGWKELEYPPFISSQN